MSSEADAFLIAEQLPPLFLHGQDRAIVACLPFGVSLRVPGECGARSTFSEVADSSLARPQHLDFVTSIAFHPKDDRFFLSGSLDCKLRLWNVSRRSFGSRSSVADHTSRSSLADPREACTCESVSSRLISAAV